MPALASSTGLVEMSEEALEKNGPELFKELLRLYGTAEVEDYFKGGQWRNELMKTDLVLVEAHRKEAGAPDPPELEDVVMPEMPTSLLSGIQAGYGPAVSPLFANKLAAVGTGPVAAAGGPVAELRLIALFVAKWKLDPSSTKLLLAKLTPSRRRYVIQCYKGQETGDAGTAELEMYIAECEANGDWDKQIGPSAVPVPVGRPIGGVPMRVMAPILRAPAGVGVKRPLVLPTTPVAQRPRFMVPQPQVTTPQNALAARLAAARAAGGIHAVRPNGPGMYQGRPQLMGMVRPAMVRPQGGLIRNLLQR